MSIYEKLFKLQGVVAGIKKESENPFFKSSYFSINDMLAVIKPELHKLNLLLLQPLSSVGEQPAIETMIVDVDTGEKVSETTPITVGKNAQDQGGSITYHRRYALQSFFALEALDDDGETAVGRKDKKPKAAAAPKPKAKF